MKKDEQSVPTKHGTTRKAIYGSLSNSNFNGVKTLLTHMKFSELLRSCSFDLIPEHLRPIYNDIQRVSTPKRRNGLEDFFYKHLAQSTLIAGIVPPILVGCMHEVEFIENNNSGMIGEIDVQQENTFIIDGINRCGTAGTIIGGFDNQLLRFGKESKNRLARRIEIRNLIAELEVPVMFIFREKGKLTKDDFAQIFCDVNGQQQPLTMNQLIKLWDDPATELAKKIGNDIVIKSHGGMTDKSKKVTENSDFIITLNSLTRFVLGAVGGYNMQTKLKGVREMNDGSIFNSSHTLEIEKDLLLFFNTWVDIQGDKFSNDRKGFQLVTTLIQALGLVFHHIWHCCSNMSKTERTHQIYIAAKKLAQINYSRDAEHWKNCSFLTLNEDDLNYKVNSGGSTTRKHFARYLCSKIGFNY